MKPIAFSGMMCHPTDIQKEGDFKIKGTVSRAKDQPVLVRYEYFPCKEQRDKRYDVLLNLIKDLP